VKINTPLYFKRKMLITTETAWGERDTHLSLKHSLLNAHGLQLCTTSMDLKNTPTVALNAINVVIQFNAITNKSWPA